MNTSRNDREMQKKCEELMNFHIIIAMKDGCKMDGIITDVDDSGVTMLVGEDVIERSDESKSRQMPRRFRRFRRRRIPFGSISGLSLLLFPFIAPPFFI
ncbi:MULTISPECIES: hypothetical protein [Paraclostridium]|uniref:hypothetical protein n=1 Tax=Paraclostridium TaxID=1849822 RepID=UPI00051D1810|nr:MULTISPECIES: hypothetical protein [Paraclostridium]KGJ48553.1 hypothetical protein KD33_14470 [Clostridium sp. NCR]MCU9813378.1 hypothetical protein [Paraclostridium sp. AKS81]